MKFYRCAKCGKLIAVIKGSACPTLCCGVSMVELKAGTTDASVEKHVPVISVSGNAVTVTVGEVIHPMEEKHYIEWIAIETSHGFQLKELKSSQEPKSSFALAESETLVKAYAYCNLHSLWASK